MSKLTIYSRSDILNTNLNDKIVAHNAFIFQDGTFTLADGFDLRKADYEIEQSANLVSRFLISKNNLLDQYRNFIKSNETARRFFYLRDVLIHYYGIALFADTYSISQKNIHDRDFDHFILPNYNYFEKKVSNDQLATLKLLMALNGEDMVPSDSDKIIHMIKEK